MNFEARYIGSKIMKNKSGKIVPNGIYTVTSKIERDVNRGYPLFTRTMDCICITIIGYNMELYYKNIEEMMCEWKIVQSFGKYKVITLCGSTRFKDEFLRVERELAKQNYIVINLGLFSKSDPKNPNEKLPTKEEHIDVHYQKIDMCDGIFVVNVDGYIGNSTLREIEYATKSGKKIFYLSRYPDIIIRKEEW